MAGLELVMQLLRLVGVYSLVDNRLGFVIKQQHETG